MKELISFGLFATADVDYDLYALRLLGRLTDRRGAVCL